MRPTASTVLAFLALAIAIGGGTAVALDGKNTVDSGDIQKGAVRASDISSVPVHYVNGPTVIMGTAAGGPSQTQTSTAKCPRGTRVVGGGWGSNGPTPVDATVSTSGAEGRAAWRVVMVNHDSIGAQFFARAQCVGAAKG